MLFPVPRAGSGGLFLWGRGYNNGPDLSRPHLVSGSQRFDQVSLGWRHGLALTGVFTTIFLNVCVMLGYVTVILKQLVLFVGSWFSIGCFAHSINDFLPLVVHDWR